MDFFFKRMFIVDYQETGFAHISNPQKLVTVDSETSYGHFRIGGWGWPQVEGGAPSAGNAHHEHVTELQINILIDLY